MEKDNTMMDEDGDGNESQEKLPTASQKRKKIQVTASVAASVSPYESSRCFIGNSSSSQQDYEALIACSRAYHFKIGN